MKTRIHQSDGGCCCGGRRCGGSARLYVGRCAGCAQQPCQLPYALARKGNGCGGRGGRGGCGAPLARGVSGVVGGCCRGGTQEGGGGACVGGYPPKKGMRQRTCQRRFPRQLGDASPQRIVLRVEMVLRDGDDGPPLRRELNGGAQEWDYGDDASRGELSQ